MLRSRANVGNKPSEDSSAARRRRRIRKIKSNQGQGRSTISTVVFCLVSFALTLAITSLAYSKFTARKLSRDHVNVVGTKHLRKSAFHGEDIESPQQDDLVPEDSLYNLAYPTMKHHGEHFHLSDLAGRVAIVINVASE